MSCFGAVLRAGENTAVALESVCFRANLTAASKRFDSESPHPVGGGSNMLRVSVTLLITFALNQTLTNRCEVALKLFFSYLNISTSTNRN